MLINLSNHPASDWSPEQTTAAQAQFGEVVDRPFPNIPPTWTHEQVHELAWAMASDLSGELSARRQKEHVVTCDQWRNAAPLDYEICTCPKDGVHLMGETSFVVAFARYWRDFTEDEAGDQRAGLYASTTEREVVALSDGTTQRRFAFVQFRCM